MASPCHKQTVFQGSHGQPGERLPTGGLGNATAPATPRGAVLEKVGQEEPKLK